VKAGNIQQRQSLKVRSVINHLNQARDEMRRLMVLSGDWSAKVEVESDFDGIEQSCRRFALHQLGLERVECEQGY
jgi:hypothetical protein